MCQADKRAGRPFMDLLACAALLCVIPVLVVREIHRSATMRRSLAVSNEPFDSARWQGARFLPLDPEPYPGTRRRMVADLLEQHLEPGKTTSDDLTALLGAPTPSSANVKNDGSTASLWILGTDPRSSTGGYEFLQVWMKAGIVQEAEIVRW